ncbi:MAG: hypothetical protein HKN79_01395 [Flavobacteriales bacterium]|nr:hypothetical protein [Flavobacteriales bacterium]
MANSASTQLHQLIHSMSRSEKRYFKIHVRTHSSKHSMDYIRLFDLIDGQETYDESPLVEQMEQDGCTQRFAVLKHRLFEKVLDALEAFQRNNDPLMTLRHELNRCRVLIHRGLLSVASRHLQKLIDQAQDLEAHLITLECLHLMAVHGLMTADDQEVHRSLRLRIAEEYDMLWDGQRLFATLKSEGRARVGEAFRGDTMIGDAEKVIRSESSSALARYTAHHALSAWTFTQQAFDQSLVHLMQCERILDAEARLRAELPLALTDIWANQCYIYLHKKQEALARNALMNLMGTLSDGFMTHHRIQYHGTRLQSLLYFLNRVEDTGLEERLKEELERYSTQRWEHTPAVRAALDYNAGVFHHKRAERSEALKALNRILNDGEIGRDEDVYHRTLVLVTVLHIESKDKDWMAHSARALKRYLKPRNLLNGVETTLLTYISNLRRAKTEEGELRAVNQLIHSLRELRSEKKEQLSFEHFDFLAWAEDRSEDDRYASMVA